MEWFPDWEARQAALVADGLPVRIVGVALLPPWDGYRLLVVEIEAEERWLPRSHVARGFPLHMSLLFENELDDGLALTALRLHERWAGRQLVLDVEWFGSGGAAFLGGALASDPDLLRLHRAGSYGERSLHVSL
jgi:hypothetical protein